MPAPVKVTITSPCNTSNNSARLSASGDNQIQWHATGDKSYTLKLPNGVFEGYPGTGTFDLAISGPGFQPEPPLTLIAQPAAQTISNYIFEAGYNCVGINNDPPPDIVIDGGVAEQESELGENPDPPPDIVIDGIGTGQEMGIGETLDYPPDIVND